MTKRIVAVLVLLEVVFAMLFGAGAALAQGLGQESARALA